MIETIPKAVFVGTYIFPALAIIIFTLFFIFFMNNKLLDRCCKKLGLKKEDKQK